MLDYSDEENYPVQVEGTDVSRESLSLVENGHI